MDFNLIVEENNIKELIQRSYDLGYECVALNTVIDSSNLSGKNINVPEPIYIEFEGKFGRKFSIFNRLTAVIEDAIHAHHLLRCPTTKKYDILALQPVGEKVLQHVVSTVDADIVCLNLSEDLGYTLKRAHVGLAHQKSMCFEISYSPCLRSQTSRRSIISNAQHLVNVSKGKNIIISSSANKPLELRSPNDVANLGLLFGFKLNQAVDAVQKNGNIVTSHAGTRKNTGCGFFSITGCMKIPKQQGWIVKMCKVPPLSTVQSSKTKKRKLESAPDIDKDKKCKVLDEE